MRWSVKQQQTLRTILEHLEQPLSKQKIGGIPGDDANKQHIGSEEQSPDPATNPWANGALAGDEPTTPPKKRRVLSTPIQAMAVIEQQMAKLTPTQAGIVCHWFAQTYIHLPPQGMDPCLPIQK